MLQCHAMPCNAALFLAITVWTARQRSAATLVKSPEHAGQNSGHGIAVFNNSLAALETVPLVSGVWQAPPEVFRNNLNKLLKGFASCQWSRTQ